jgi:DNA-binding NarL/FixJ family response regulator
VNQGPTGGREEERHVNRTDEDELHRRVLRSSYQTVTQVTEADIGAVLGDILTRVKVTMNESLNRPAGRTAGAVLTRFRVLLVDDHQLIRVGLRQAFGWDGDLEVVGEAGSVAGALAAVDRLRPDVLVTDVKLPDGDGIALAAKVRSAHPAIGIVVLTMYAGDEHLFAALNAGANAFVGKDAPAAEVVAAARHAATNPRAFTARDLAAATQRRVSAQTGPRLSLREREVLVKLVEGLSSAQVARRLFITEATVKTHITRIYQKLGVGNRAQAVRAAIRLGLVSPDKDR